MSTEQPFHHLFESFGRLPQSHSDAINHRAYQALLDALSVPLDHPGRCVLLRAPRAGHGKTHLLSRIQHHLAPGHEFIPLHPASGSRIDAASVTDDALRRIGRPLPAAGGLCGLDLVVRRLYSLALQPLVSSGEVPCVDRDGALASLRNRPLETFDFQHPTALTAHWIRDNFEVLGPRLALELSQLTGTPSRAIGFWVDAMFHFAVTPTDLPGRVDSLAIATFSSGVGDGVAMERLSALLALLSLLMRVVLVADDLEGFSADESAALRLAAFLSSLRQSAERLDVVLSINQDIWDSAFVPRLSGGLADRLSEIVIELEPLTQPQMVALLESRVPGLGARVLDYIRARELETHARGVLRAASAAWARVSRQGAELPASPATIAVPPPVASVAQEAPPQATEPGSELTKDPSPDLPPATTVPEPPSSPFNVPEMIGRALPPEPVPETSPPPVSLAAKIIPEVVDSPFHSLAQQSGPPVAPVADVKADLSPSNKPLSTEPSAAVEASVVPEPSSPPAPPAWEPPAIHEVPVQPPSEVVPEPTPPTPPAFSTPPAWEPPAIHEVPVQPSSELAPEPTPPAFSTPPAWEAPAIHEVPVQPPSEVAPEPAPTTPPAFSTPPAWEAPAIHEVPVPPPSEVAPEPTPEPPPVFQIPPAWEPPAIHEVPVQPPSAVAPEPTPEPPPVFQIPPAWEPPAIREVPVQPPSAVAPEPTPEPPPVFSTPPVWGTPQRAASPEPPSATSSPTAAEVFPVQATSEQESAPAASVSSASKASLLAGAPFETVSPPPACETPGGRKPVAEEPAVSAPTPPSEQPAFTAPPPASPFTAKSEPEPTVTDPSLASPFTAKSEPEPAVTDPSLASPFTAKSEPEPAVTDPSPASPFTAKSEPAPPLTAPPLASPFTAKSEPEPAARVESTPEPADLHPSGSSAAWHDATAPTAPFSVPPAEAVDPPPPPPAPAAPPQAQPPIDQDRVEDLLRQFRERYSRPNS